MSERRMPAVRARNARPQRRGSLLSTVVAAAVTAVIVASAATAFLLEQADTNGSQAAMLEPEPARAPSTATEGAKPSQDGEVVTAPPLKHVLPPQSSAGEVAEASATNVLGAPATCPNCGVVETVVAVHAYGEAQARAYQMHIRMDNGSVRTVEHRGALPAGSRVVVEGAQVRPLPALP